MIRYTKKESKHSEEMIKEIINAKLDGDHPTYLAAKYGVSVRLIRSWYEGTNRGHILDAVLEQRHKEGKL